MTEAILRSIIEALRDTAAKTAEQIEVHRAASQPADDRFYSSATAHSHIDVRDRYPREWIAGRLLGMADVAEAMIGKEIEP